jgi:predicted phage terminase large subunit-like protein
MYEKAEQKLYKFFASFWNTFDPSPLVDNWSIQCMCEHVQAALERDIRRLIINISPRSSKSTVSSISSPAWWHIDHPYEKFWLVSHTQKLFTQNIVYARRILDHPLYRERWCDPKLEDHYRFTLSTDVNTKTRIENNQGGYILGGSPSSGALGMGYSVAILDDILDSEESNNPEMVQGVNNWFTQTFLNRSNDVRSDVVIIVMQRLASGDLTDYVMEKYGDQGWFLLNIPAKYDPDRTFISPIGFNDPRTKRNQLMDPNRLPEDFLAVQAKDPLIYNTRYQQNPDAESDGNLIKAEWVQETSTKPTSFSSMITVWDLAFTDEPTSTYTVGLVLGKSDGKYYLIDMYRDRIDAPAQKDAILKMRQKYPRSIVGIEKRANGHAVMSMLQRDITNIYAFEPRLFGGSKEQRLSAVLPLFRDKQVYIYSPFEVDATIEQTYSADVIKKELKAFPLAKHDDIVDCTAYGLAYLAQKGQESTAIVTQGQRIRLGDEDYDLPNRKSSSELFEDERYFLSVDCDRAYLNSLF